MALSYLERFARTVAHELCERITVDYAQPDGLARVSLGESSTLVPIDNLASRETTFAAIADAVRVVLGQPRQAEPPAEPFPLQRESCIIQNADGYRARLVAPPGPAGERWDPHEWRGSYRVQHDDLNGTSRFYEFVQLPNDPDGTRVFGWLQIPELPRQEIGR